MATRDDAGGANVACLAGDLNVLSADAVCGQNVVLGLGLQVAQCGHGTGVDVAVTLDLHVATALDVLGLHIAASVDAHVLRGGVGPGQAADDHAAGQKGGARLKFHVATAGDVAVDGDVGVAAGSQVAVGDDAGTADDAAPAGLHAHVALALRTLQRDGLTRDAGGAVAGVG
jgi:hypothetical protein